MTLLPALLTMNGHGYFPEIFDERINISLMIRILRDWEDIHKSYFFCSEIFNQLIKADSDINGN